MTGGEAALARARALVGARFRPQGRTAEQGLDCLGLVALAAGLSGEAIPNGYPLRSRMRETVRTIVPEGLHPLAPDQAEVGDILLVEAGPGQHHFLLLADGGFIHADAGLGRVVEIPGGVPWPAIAAWRIVEK